MMGEEKEGVLIIEGHEREGEARGTDTGDTEAPCLLPLRQICRFRVAGCAWHRIAGISQSWNAYVKENRRPPQPNLFRGENRVFVRLVLRVRVPLCTCMCVYVGSVLATSSLVCRSENLGDEDPEWSGVVASSPLPSSISRFEASQEGITIVDYC